MSYEQKPGVTCTFQVWSGGRWVDYWSGPVPEEFLEDEGGAQAYLESQQQGEFAIGHRMRMVRWTPEVVAEVPGLGER